MKSREANLTKVKSYNITPVLQEETLQRVRRISAPTPPPENSITWTRRWHLAALSAAGYFTVIPLALAHGNSSGHAGMGSQGNTTHNEHWRYFDRYSGLSSNYHAGLYESVYCYTPTSEQQAKAKQQVQTYLLGVKQRRHRAANHRYISVETLRPTKRQAADFVRQQQSTGRVQPDQLRCLMVFDTQSREFVGAKCYVVSTVPLAGEVTQFEAVSAEFVGQEKL